MTTVLSSTWVGNINCQLTVAFLSFHSDPELAEGEEPALAAAVAFAFLVVIPQGFAIAPLSFHSARRAHSLPRMAQ
jgi:hypothetical protein